MLLKKLKFFHLLGLSKIDREKVFADVLDKKEAYKTIKKTVYEKRKIIIFLRGQSIVLVKILTFLQL